jgi:predicted MFS family arabinose efflux permease
MGGVLVALVGASTTLTVVAASYLACFGLLAMIATPLAPAPAAPHRPIGAEIAEGLRVLRSHRLLAVIAGGTAAANLIITAIGALEIVFLVRAVGASSNLVGAILTIGGVGGLAGALLSRRLNDRYGAGRVATAAFLVTALAALLLPVAQAGVTVALFAVGVCAISFGISLASVALVTLRLRHTPQRLQGRVGAVSQALNAASIPLGAVLGGMAGQLLGTRAALAALALGYVAFGIAFVRSPVRTASASHAGRADDAVQ